MQALTNWDSYWVLMSLQVKLQCQKGIPASLRAKCWPLLCGASERMRQNENLYESLDSQPGLQSWVDIIERDLDRQFPFHEMFLSKDGHGQRGLFRVLKAYTQFQPEEGYCQAQGPVAAVLLMNMPAEEAFWCLVQISEQYLPGYYSPLLVILFDAAILSWVLKKTCPAAHKHLQQHGVEPLMFATDWLMCLFTRHLPFNTLLRVWDLFFCYGVSIRCCVLLQVAVVLVRRVLGRAEQRKQCPGQMETLESLRGVREHVQEEEETFIAEVTLKRVSTPCLFIPLTDDAGERQEQQPDASKRFGLFRKLKGEQPKKAKPKKKPKMQVPKILIQDFSDVMPADEPAVQEDAEEKLSSRERRRRRREQERKEKEEEKLRKKKEKEQERERRKPQTRGKSFQGPKEKVTDDPAKTVSQITRNSVSYAESYF
uniref:Rab-GAP TBC domain-containing protein n=1 Tax=Xiphophorus couchianus TaxID=32473 RepID=A0A3B5L4P6_9TELE